LKDKNILSDLIDLSYLVPCSLEKRYYLEENILLRKIALFHYILWPTLSILYFFLADFNKEPLVLFILYRFGIVLALIIMAVFSYLFRHNNNLIKLSLFMSAAAINIFISWSMTFGYPVLGVWIILNGCIIVATISDSFLFSLFWITLIFLISNPFWGQQYPIDDFYILHINNSIQAIMFFLFGHVYRRFRIMSVVNKFLHDDLMEHNLKLQIDLDNEIKKFIAPVLVKKIEEQTKKDIPIAIAIDDILVRRVNEVAVLFSDIRNFSTRSIDIDFVEKELIPSSIKLIDTVEANMGIAKQIGDAIFVYYAFEGVHPDAAKEAIIRGFKDAVEGCFEEKTRIKNLNRNEIERFFSLTYGKALVGNMASLKHREATVIGSPANLAARMDSLTKEPSFKALIKDGDKILVSKAAKDAIDYFGSDLKFEEINLEAMNLIMKSFPEEKLVYLFKLDITNIEKLNEILVTNEINKIEINL